MNILSRRFKSPILLWVTCITLHFCSLGFGAPPENDDFQNALELSSWGGEVTGNNFEATSELGEPQHDGENTLNSVWYHWKIPASGRLTLYTFGSNFDTVMAAYSGDSLDNLEPLASNDDSPWGFESLIEIEVTAGEDLRIAVAGFNGEFGIIHLIWHLEPFANPPPENDLFKTREELTSSFGNKIQSNLNSSLEEGEPLHHSINPKTSLWYKVSFDTDGILILDSHGTTYQRSIAIYSGETIPDLKPVPDLNAADDDNPQSLRSIRVEAGTEYSIAIADQNGGVGLAIFTWQFLPNCEAPPEPAYPEPDHEGTLLATSTTLAWGPMIPLFKEVIYGSDDRQDMYELNDPKLIRLAQATGAVVNRHNLIENGSYYELRSLDFGTVKNLCEDEPYFHQPVVSECSGFLAGPGVFITAGHCIDNIDKCRETAIVFGYYMLDQDTPVLRIPKKDVYFCSGIINRKKQGFEDWAILRLDREVPDRTPMPIRTEGELSDNEAIFALSFPQGLPLKYSGGANVRDNHSRYYFSSNLDINRGSSGGPVIHRESLEVEGIIVGGEDDFVLNDELPCFESNRCPDDGCLGETVTRISNFRHFIPDNGGIVEYDVFIGETEDHLELLTTTLDTRLPVDGLEIEKTYYWQVIARDSCGETPGPIWSFNIQSAPEFERGEAVPDGNVDITDGIQIIGFIFLGTVLEIDCRDALDIDDNGRLEITDPIALLSHLFLGTAAPPPPWRSCGQDPTPDESECVYFPGCQP